MHCVRSGNQVDLLLRDIHAQKLVVLRRREKSANVWLYAIGAGRREHPGLLEIELY
jgi:hypothetical protein